MPSLKPLPTLGRDGNLRRRWNKEVARVLVRPQQGRERIVPHRWLVAHSATPACGSSWPIASFRGSAANGRFRGKAGSD